MICGLVEDRPDIRRVTSGRAVTTSSGHTAHLGRSREEYPRSADDAMPSYWGSLHNLGPIMLNRVSIILLGMFLFTTRQLVWVSRLGLQDWPMFCRMLRRGQNIRSDQDMSVSLTCRDRTPDPPENRTSSQFALPCCERSKDQENFLPNIRKSRLIIRLEGQNSPRKEKHRRGSAAKGARVWFFRSRGRAIGLRARLRNLAPSAEH